MIIVHLSGTLCENLNLICSAYVVSKKYCNEMKISSPSKLTGLLSVFNKQKYTEINAKSGNFTIINDINQIEDNGDYILTNTDTNTNASSINIKSFNDFNIQKKFKLKLSEQNNGYFYIYIDIFKPEYNTHLKKVIEHIEDVYFSQDEQLGTRIKYIVLGKSQEIAKYPLFSTCSNKYKQFKIMLYDDDENLEIMINSSVGGISFNGKHSLGWWGLFLNPTRPMMILSDGIDLFDGSISL